MKSTTLGVTSKPIYTGKSRQRIRTEKNALAFLDRSLRLPPLRRRKALDRIRSAKQPAREAQKIVRESLDHASRETLDHSDVQELRVRLLRRDITLCPEQHDWLSRLDVLIAKGRMSRDEFDAQAEALMLMENSLPPRHRRDERHYEINHPARGVA